MRNLFVAFALASLPLPALAAHPIIFQATSADKASGFKTMAECEAALGRPAKRRGKAAKGTSSQRGTIFNRTAGNVSRCEMVAGEPQVTVYPTGQKGRSAR